MMKVLAIIVTAVVVLFQSTACANVSVICFSLNNPACTCINSSTSTPFADITCTFNVSKTDSPLFSNSSFASSITLSTLDLSDNALEHLPNNFLNGEKIGTLVLRNNRFASVPTVLTKAGGMTTVDLSSNDLTGLSVDILGDIPGLQMLDLSNNQLTTLATEQDQNNTLLDLKELNLAKNAIRSINGSMFSSMTKLATLSLAQNHLEEVTQNTFLQLKHTLVALDLSSNLLTQVHSHAFQPLDVLRDLNLRDNHLLGDLVGTFQFPQHLRSLDLGNCGVASFSRCQFEELSDLVWLQLQDNPLNCTCELYHLQDWYQNQGANGSQWTCQVSAGPADSSSSRQTIAVTHLKPQCRGSYTVCPSALDMVSQMKATLDIDVLEDRLVLTWTLEGVDELSIYGFKLRYMPESGEHVTSDLVPVQRRRLVMDTLERPEHFMVCLDVLAYENAVVRQLCESVTDENSNAVVGILAGVVFLMPCIVVLVIVLIKDYRITQADYQGVDGGKDVEKQEPDDGKAVVVSIGTDGRKLGSSLAGKKAQQPHDLASTTGVVVMHPKDTNEMDVHRNDRAAESVNGEASSVGKQTDDEQKKSAEHQSPDVREQGQGIGNPAFQHNSDAGK